MFDFLKRLFGSKSDQRHNLPNVNDIRTAVMPPHAPPPPPPTLEEAREWVRDHMRRDIASGFYSREDVIRTGIEMHEDELAADDIEAFVTATYDELLAEHQADQATWPAQTDCDRLDAAFAALEEQGVIARQNFSCCGTCGSGEIWDEVEDVRAQGRPAHGYAFYHMQDTESAVEGDSLYLNYGSEEEGPGTDGSASVRVGHQIVETLRNHGLKSDWDGTIGQRIGVPLDWKRRQGPVPSVH